MNVVAGVLLLTGSVAIAGPALGEQDCQVAKDARIAAILPHVTGSTMQCRCAAVVNDADISVEIVRHHAPIGLALYEYLLDHPEITSRLSAQFGMGHGTIVEEDADHFRVDDGEGAEGRVTVVHRYGPVRLYLIEGQHRSILFPTVRVTTAVLINLEEMDGGGRDTVDASLLAYSRFEKEAWARMLLMAKPLMIVAVRRMLEKQFTMTDRLGALIVESPDRVIRQIVGLSLPSDERDRLLSMIRQTTLPAGSPVP